MASLMKLLEAAEVELGPHASDLWRLPLERVDGGPLCR
jgi:hypothetical protein